MFKYAIIDNTKRSVNGTLTVESIVAARLANTKRAALSGFEGNYMAIPESHFQGKGDHRFREKIQQLKEEAAFKPLECAICGSTNNIMTGSIELLCADCYDDVEADI